MFSCEWKAQTESGLRAVYYSFCFSGHSYLRIRWGKILKNNYQNLNHFYKTFNYLDKCHVSKRIHRYQLGRPSVSCLTSSAYIDL